MDQLKAQLAVAFKYGFWISSGLILIVSVVMWYLSTSKLTEESEKQTAAIKSAISQVSSTRQELPTLPNDHSHKEMERLIQDRQDEVLKSWTTLYERQQDILKWPVDELKQDFVDEFKDLIPIEIHVEHPTAEVDELETTLRSRYATYIQNVLPDIAKIAKTEWTAKFDQASMGMDMMEDMGGMGAMPMMMREDVDITGAKEGPLVEWSSGSQSSVLEDLFPWRGELPTTLEIYYSQENLWILRQLMQIVADVNGEASQPFQAKIREIRRIGIGDSVEFGAGSITAPGASGMGFGMGMGMEMDMEMMMDMDGGMEMDMGYGDMGTESKPDPAENRYVNASLEAIAASSLRSALTSNSPSDASLAVAKRVPVMLSLTMDQRAVPELVAACGSAPLMVEVNQVRVLPKTSASGGGGMMGDEMGMGMEMEMDMDMGMGGMGGMGGGMATPTEPADEFPLDMSVEVYGIIYIYNPPDPVKLGVEQVTEDTVVDGGTETMGGQPVAPPATTPAQPDTQEGELPTPQPQPTPPAVTPPPGDTSTPPAGATTPPAGTTTPPGGTTTPPGGTTTPPVTGAPSTTPPAAILPIAQP